MKTETDKLLLAVHLGGTLFFWMEGALSAISGNLDFLGLMVLACATAFGGGIIRDLLIGDIPPPSLRDWRYVAVVGAAGGIVFFLHRVLARIPEWTMMGVDAAGLSLFAIAGRRKPCNSKCTHSSPWRWE